MRSYFKGMLRGLILGSAAAVLVACGGGGGGSGSPLVPNPLQPLSLTFTADKTVLPLNLQGEPAAMGSPYTAAINLRASYMPGGGPEGGNCWTAAFTVIGGQASGRLSRPSGVFFDPISDFQVTFNGNWPILLTATDLVGVVTIEAATPNPDTAVVECNDDKVEVGARFEGTPITYIRKQFQVQVGGASSGFPGQLVLTTAAPNFLFMQGLNGPTQLVVQVQVVDEAGQPVPNPPAGTANLLASIITGPPGCDAGSSANLRVGSVTAKSVSSASINGMAQFTVISGTAPGTICVEFYSDRSDNNVSNGISNLVYNAVGVPVVVSVGTAPLAISTGASLPDATKGVPYATILSATGGVPPYSWTLEAGSHLPSGLSMSTGGVITGTPLEFGLNFRFAVRVTDSGFPTASSVVGEFEIDIAEGEPTPPPPLAITTNALPAGTVGSSYLAVAVASGGTPPYTWSATPTPFASGLTINSDGVISGTPVGPAGVYQVALTVKAGDETKIRTYLITINP